MFDKSFTYAICVSKFSQSSFATFYEDCAEKLCSHETNIARRDDFSCWQVRRRRMELFSEVSDESENCPKLSLLKVHVRLGLYSHARYFDEISRTKITYSRPTDTMDLVLKVECAIICVHGTGPSYVPIHTEM